MSCADCFSGHVHAGAPTGSETTLAGLPTYVSRPPEGREIKGVVMFIPDMFGWAFVNNRLLSDAYAEKGGFVVYLPDLMGGESLSFSILQYKFEVVICLGLWMRDCLFLFLLYGLGLLLCGTLLKWKMRKRGVNIWL
jgi:hypothetical protein